MHGLVGSGLRQLRDFLQGLLHVLGFIATITFVIATHFLLKK
jgi:hypothetical protein